MVGQSYKIMKAYIVNIELKKVYEQIDLMCGDGNDAYRATLLATAEWYGENSEYVIPCSKMQTILFASVQRAAAHRNEEIGTVLRSISSRIGNVDIFDTIKNMYDNGEVVVFAVNPDSALRIVERDIKGE